MSGLGLLALLAGGWVVALAIVAVGIVRSWGPPESVLQRVALSVALALAVPVTVGAEIVLGGLRGLRKGAVGATEALRSIWTALVLLVLGLSACGGGTCDRSLVMDGAPADRWEAVVAAVEARCGPVAGIVHWRAIGAPAAGDACAADLTVGYGPAGAASSAWWTSLPADLCWVACGEASDEAAAECARDLFESVGGRAAGGGEGGGAESTRGGPGRASFRGVAR